MKIKSLLLITIILVISTGSVVFSSNVLAFNTRVVTTLDTSAYYLREVSTYGKTVAWKGFDSTNNVQRIYYWDGDTIQAISPATMNAYDPSLYNGTIAWTSGLSGEIYYWDGSYVNCEPSIIQVTNNSVSDYAPSLDNGEIAWYASDGNDTEIYHWDGTFVGGAPAITQITDNEVGDAFPEMHNGLIAWRNNGVGAFKLNYWDGTGIKVLADNYSGNDSIGVHNGGISWVGSVELECGLSSEVLYWDGSFTAGVENITQVTNNNCVNYYPANSSLYNGTITWVQASGADEAIFYWNGSSVIEVSESYPIDFIFKPAIHSGGIAYAGRQQGLSTGLHEIRFVTGLE